MLIGYIRVSTADQSLDLQRCAPRRWRRAHINMLGRYAFTLTDTVARGKLRSLRDPNAAEIDDP